MVVGSVSDRPITDVVIGLIQISAGQSESLRLFVYCPVWMEKVRAAMTGHVRLSLPSTVVVEH